MTLVEGNIWRHQIGEPLDHDARYTEPGWYFSDEAEDLNGPYDSRQQAEEGLLQYCKLMDLP